MSNVKISELSNVSSVANADLFPLSKSMGGGLWQSKSITAANLLKSLVASSRTIVVAKDGVSDATTIKTGIALASALSPTQADPVAVQVSPGQYTEDNPIAIPPWVTLYAEGDYYSAEVIPSNDGVVFSASGSSILNGFTIYGANAFSNVAYKSTTYTNSEITRCLIYNCDIGVLSQGGSITCNNITGISTVKVFSKFVSCINGGFLSCVDCSVTGTITRPTYTYHCEDTDSQLYLFTCAVNNCINGVYVNSDGYIDVLSCHIESADNAIFIDTTGSSYFKSSGIIIEDSVVYDVKILSPNARFSFSGGHFNSYKRSIVSGATVDIVADDEGLDGAKFVGESNLEGAFGMGRPGATYEQEDIVFNVGDARSYYLDQFGDTIAEYWYYNASNASGSRFTQYVDYAGSQLADNNDAIIIGSKYPFPAIRLEILSAANVGSNTIVAEYWDGSAWQSTTMCAYNRETMDRSSNRPFESVEDHYVEISQKVLENVDTVSGWNSDRNILDEVPDWTVGYDLYPLRFRNNGALVTGMTFRSGEVRGDGHQVSTTSAKTIRWGKFRAKKTIYVDSAGLDKSVDYPPSDVPLRMSANISYQLIPSFNNNMVSEITTAFLVPYDIDTASPLTCYFDGIASSANTGAISTTAYVSRIDASAVLIVAGALPETVYNQFTNVAGVANSFTVVSQEVDISGYGTNDVVLIGFKRNGTNVSDTYDGDFLLGDITFQYYSKFS